MVVSLLKNNNIEHIAFLMSYSRVRYPMNYISITFAVIHHVSIPSILMLSHIKKTYDARLYGAQYANADYMN